MDRDKETRLTLRLPGLLHNQLASQAEAEHRSLNQHLVHVLEEHIMASEQKARWRDERR
jgi:predicted HicB family RNase H-like nuclease